MSGPLQSWAAVGTLPGRHWGENRGIIGTVVVVLTVWLLAPGRVLRVALMSGQGGAVGLGRSGPLAGDGSGVPAAVSQWLSRQRSQPTGRRTLASRVRC